MMYVKNATQTHLTMEKEDVTHALLNVNHAPERRQARFGMAHVMFVKTVTHSLMFTLDKVQDTSNQYATGLLKEET